MDRHEGFVALFDVLGFTNLISRATHVEELHDYIGRVREATREASKGVQYVLFSDSIILTTPDKAVDSFLALIMSCSQLFRFLLMGEIPVRGAIALGSFLRHQDESGVFIAGKPIIEAYQVEKSQDWIGVILATSVIREFPKLEDSCKIGNCYDEASAQKVEQNLPWSLFLQRWLNIPHQPPPHPLASSWLDGFALVPTEGQRASPKNIIDCLGQCRDHVERIKSLAPDPRSQTKAAATINWIDNLKSRWAEPNRWWNQHYA